MKKILVIDDDKEFTDSVQNMLETRGYRVITALDGTAGLETAEREKPDLIILDVMMKSATEGFEISRKIQKHEQLKTIPVILLTGIREKMNLVFRFEPDENWLPVHTVLEKPVKPDVMLEHIKKCLKKQRNERGPKK